MSPTQTNFYTEQLLHTEAFTHRSLYTHELLHRKAITLNRFYTEMPLHEAAVTQKFLHTGTFTHRRGASFTHRRLYAEKLIRFIHTEAFAQKIFSAQNLLCTEDFTHRRL